MLPRAQRLTSTLDYSRVVRRGARFSSSRLVLHVDQTPSEILSTGQSRVRFGFVVSKAVGSAPRRNRVRRQFRELARSATDILSGDIVVRALPAAADATWDELSADFAACVRKWRDANA